MKKTFKKLFRKLFLVAIVPGILIFGTTLFSSYALAVAWDISTAIHIQSLPISGQEIFPNGVSFKSDGSKMYVTGQDGDDVIEYDLSAPWNVSTAVYLQAFSVATEDVGPTGIFFKPDGTKFYITGNAGDEINEYNLGTPWDISTASFVQVLSVATENITPTGPYFRSDGLKMYITGAANNEINEYNLSTPWDISTASFAQVELLSPTLVPSGLFFNSDGTSMFVIHTNSPESVDQYSLSVAWDVSTAVYVQKKLIPEDTNPSGLYFSPDGSRFYTTGSNGDEVNEYTLAPNMPNARTTILLTSGTTWVVPSNWNSNNNTVEVIGGGGAGGGGTGAGGPKGGGGGGYSKVSNLSLTPGASVTYQVGAGGTGVAGSAGGSGTDTWFNAANLAACVTAGYYVCVGAAAGTGGSASGGGAGAGGASSSGVGVIRYSGGNGGQGDAANGGGGGGAAGVNGNGGNGAAGPSVGANVGGSGGGAGGGGSAGEITVNSSTTGANGGANYFGNGAGSGSTTGVAGGSGSLGGGGGGGGSGAAGGAGGSAGGVGGGGGGGGAGGGAVVNGGAAGNYGGGGGAGARASGSTGGNGAGGVILITYEPVQPKVVLFLTSGTTWTVPKNWNSGSNSVEAIGGGGGGNGPGGTQNGSRFGGGGGAYAKASNIVLTPGTSITYQVGQGGLATGTDSYFNRHTGSSDTCSVGEMSVCAKGGAFGYTSAASGGGQGGSAASSIGDIKYEGGDGGSNTGDGGAGGGGAAGPMGAGANGGNGSSQSGTAGGGGGGGNGGGSAGATGSAALGGNGGNNAGALGAGVGGSPGTAGSYGAGGGGGDNLQDGGDGGNGNEWGPTYGSGGGGGAAGHDFSGTFPDGGLYGGGGAGKAGDSNGIGGSGAQGLIVIMYDPLPNRTLRLFSRTLAGATVKFLNGKIKVFGS